jgi:hypothetical protein
MSDPKNNYALKAINLMGCLFVKTFQDSKTIDGKYDDKIHLKMYLAKFSEIGFAGSKMDDLMSFYEILSFTVDKGKTVQQYISKKLTSSPNGFGSFVDDDLLKKVPLVQLDKLISQICQEKSLSILLSTKGLTPAPAPVPVTTTVIQVKTQAWYTRYDLIFLGLIAILVVLLIIYVFYLLRPSSSTTYAPQYGGRRSKASVLKKLK